MRRGTLMIDEVKLRRKIKRILKPYLSVAANGYGKCELCGTETSWLANNRFVCPQCSEKYGFVGKNVIPDPCEVCGRQGEWLCGDNGQHSLCHRHRDSWLGWNATRNFLLQGYENLPPDEKHVVWETCFDTFIQEAKQRSKGNDERRE